MKKFSYSNRILALLFAALWISVGAELRAEVADGLLSAKVPVADQSEGSRQRALREALAQVLVKQTGSMSVLNNPGVQQALSLTPHYVTQYGYTRIPDFTAEGEDTLALTASFSESAVSRLLQREQLPVWPANRMAMLIWLLHDDPEFGKQHVTPDVMPNAYRALEMALQRRGVPVLKPSLDLQDRLTLRPEQAWDFAEEPFAAAAQRYDAALWLALRLYQSGDGAWRGSAWANIEGRMFIENVAAENVAGLIDQAVDRIVDDYARFYTYVPQLQSEGLRITVANVNSYTDYRRVIEYLQNLELVENLTLESVQNDQLRLELKLNSQASLLHETLRRDPRFTVVEDVAAPGLAGAPAQLSYHFSWTAR